MAPKRYREKVVGWILNQNYSKVCLFLERRMVSLPSLPNPLLTVPAFQTRKGGRRKREDGFKDARYSPPQLSASEAELPSHPPQEIRTQSQPLPRRFPQCAPSPHYSTALGAKTDSSQGLLQSFSSASPGSRSPSPGSAASGCAPDRSFSLPHPASALARPLAQGLEVGGHSGHRWGPGNARRSSGVFPPHSGAAWAVGEGLYPVCGSEPGTAPQPGTQG